MNVNCNLNRKKGFRMADLIRTNSGAAIMKDKLGSPSTGSDDGGEQGTEGGPEPEEDVTDGAADRAALAPPETEW